MKKDVMIFIKGTQEVDGEKDTIELMTKGRYYKRRDVLYLSYDEMDEEDTEPTMKTLLKIEGNDSSWYELKTFLQQRHLRWLDNLILTRHSPQLDGKCYGYHLFVDNQNIIYTGPPW